MTQEEKDLLLKDLCGRLPYGVKCCIYNFGGNTIRKKEDILWSVQGDNVLTLKSYVEKGEAYMYHQIKPYLFPLSSMTNELWDKEFRGYGITEYTRDSFKYDCEILDFNDSNIDLSNMVGFINQLIKHHFDVYELIPLGLAIDATGLNIY